LVGVVLGLGAPIGYFLLRRLMPRSVQRADRMASAYMAIATPVVFGVLGRMLGERQERIDHKHQEVERFREEFAAIVAHDLRNPISTIKMQLELLQRGATGDASVPIEVPIEALRRLSRGASRLDEMVGDLLDATCIEVSRLNLRTEPVALPEVVAALVDRMRPSLGQHPIEIVSNAPPRVLADSKRLEQVIANLVENAAKYSPPDAPITIELGADRDSAVVRVRDRGFGIAAEDLPLLFDRFYQAKRARARKTGLGLGLYIAKGLIEAHGGHIGVESQVDRGSTFSIWLPALTDRPA
jgi:signal transduction histidine kinase